MQLFCGWQFAISKLTYNGNKHIGLAAMVILSVLPVGLFQTVASVQEGLWFARSAEFIQQSHIVTFKWLRIVGDTLFAAGSLAMVWFIFGLAGGWSVKKR